VLASSRPIFIEWEQTLKDFITVRIKSLTSQPLNVTNQQCRSLERHKAARRPVCLEVHICSQTALHYANWQPYFSVSLYLSQKDVIVFKTVIFEEAWFFISRERSKNNFSISVLKLSSKWKIGNNFQGINWKFLMYIQNLLEYKNYILKISNYFPYFQSAYCTFPEANSRIVKFQPVYSGMKFETCTLYYSTILYTCTFTYKIELLMHYRTESGLI